VNCTFQAKIAASSLFAHLLESKTRAADAARVGHQQHDRFLTLLRSVGLFQKVTPPLVVVTLNVFSILFSELL